MSSGLYQIRDKSLDTTLDLTRLKPYGDTMNDGKVQTSFTLPVRMTTGARRRPCCWWCTGL